MGKFRAGLAAAMPWILATAAIAAVIILGECNMFEVEPRVRMIRTC